MGRKNDKTNEPRTIIYGSGRDDEFIIGGYSYEIHGWGGNDYIADEAGGLDAQYRDWFFGHEGNDTLISLNGNDRLYGGNGRDDFFILAGDQNVFVNGQDHHDELTVWIDGWHSVTVVDPEEGDYTIRIGNGKKITVESVEELHIEQIPEQYLY